MCVLTMTLGTTLTTALAASLTSTIGATAATITSGVVVGAGLAAVDGAIMGAAGAGISGGDVGEGAVKGLWMGAATGAVGGGLVQTLGATGLIETAASNAAQAAEYNSQLASMAGEGAVEMNGEMFSVVGEGSNAHYESIGKLASLDGTSLAKQGLVAVTTDAGVGVAKGATEATTAGTKSADGASNGVSGEDIAKGAVGAGMQLASGAVEAYGYREEAKDNSAILEAQAKNAEVQARQQIEAAEIEAKDLSRKQRLAIGKGKVAAAANGVMLEGRAESSPAMWEQDMQAEAAWDREKLFYNANLRADAMRNQASIYRQQASNVRSSGNLKSTSALIKGAAGAGLSLFGNSATTLFG